MNLDLDARLCTCTATETCTRCLERYAENQIRVDESVARIRRRPSFKEIFERMVEENS